MNLPFIDFGQQTKQAKDEPSPAALGTSIPNAPFVIRFEGRKAAGQKHFKVLVYLKKRRAQGDLSIIASCRVEPIGDPNADVAIYEGTCRKPALKGDCLIEVKRGKAYLVRSTEVR
ncbi:MAG TPA: hypothetical protein VFV87_09865 [Pirellulaceae bacterium]|nr:hypothetical protein [Pirellulaceae bacterium]